MKRAVGEIEGKKVIRKAYKQFVDGESEEIKKIAEAAAKHTPDAVKYCLDTEERINKAFGKFIKDDKEKIERNTPYNPSIKADEETDKAYDEYLETLASTNTSEVFFDDTKQEVKDGK